MPPSIPTVKSLWTRARNQCAWPTCVQVLTEDAVDVKTGESFVTVVGEQAHIRSRKPNGPRHDPDYDKSRLDSHENLILLCPTHHTVIDDNNGAAYDAEALVKLREVHERRQDQFDRINASILAYVGEQYEFDDKVLFEQVDLNGPSVDSMFVDVPFSCRADASVAALMGGIASEHPGDSEATDDADGQIVTGAAQALLHPDWSSSALLVGGPGQGKSTLLQFVSQFYRARLLGRENYTGANLRLGHLTDIDRIPVRLDLRKYASWAAQKQRKIQAQQKQFGKGKKQPQEPARWPGIEEYILSEIRAHNGGLKFTQEDLVTLLAARAVLIALDGLDEVADLKLREQVSDAIVATNAHLQANAANLVVLVATRPGATTTALWSSAAFPQLRLRRLSQGLRLQYLQKWAAVAELSQESTDDLQRTFMDNQHVPHIRELAAYPMQLAILLHLLQRRRLLPQQRTDLYDDYLKTFLDREQTRDKEPLLAEERKVIEDVHAYIGWYIQTQVEMGKGNGAIKRDELKKLLRAHLADRDDGQKLADALLTALTSRVLCLIERDTGWFEFEVQSLREYFAAVYIFDQANPKLRDACLTELLRRPYWSNVVRFYVGKYAPGEVRGMQDIFDELSKQNDFRLHPLLRSTAALFLNDRAYHGQNAQPIQRVVDFILGGPGVVLAQDGLLDVAGSDFQLSERAGRSQAVIHIKKRLPVEPSSEVRAALTASLTRHVTDEDRLTDWWWQNYEQTWAWLAIASQIGALASPGTDQEAKLTKLLAAATSESDWATRLLAVGGYVGTSDAVLQVVKAEVNDGAAEVIAPPTNGSAIAHVLTAAAYAQHRPVRNGSDNNRRSPRTRVRNKTSKVVLTEIVESEGNLRKHPEADATAQDWQNRLTVIEQTWADGWVLRQAVAGVPAAIDLDALAKAVVAGHPTLAFVVTAESEARGNRGNADWWRAALESTKSDLARRHWVFSVLSLAHSPAAVELASELNAVVDSLSPKHYRILRAAVQATRKLSVGRALMIQDPLRLQQVTFSPHVLWLARAVATDGSVEQIDKKLPTDISVLLTAGMGDMRELVRIVGAGSKKVPFAQFRGGRAALAAGGWASNIKLGAISKAAADDVLANPADWPGDLVQHAAGAIETRMTKQVTPLASVADADNWFA